MWLHEHVHYNVIAHLAVTTVILIITQGQSTAQYSWDKDWFTDSENNFKYFNYKITPPHSPINFVSFFFDRKNAFQIAVNIFFFVPELVLENWV